MEKTLAVINEMEQEGIIDRYAIGGAIAATLYVEPVQTYDLDIFVIFPVSPTGLISVSPIYAYLTARGYVSEGEAINIEGWPVQFLPVFNALTDEALAMAEDVTFGETPTRVLSAEHLAAIMLQTGRPKDYARLAQFVGVDIIDQNRFGAILDRHDLRSKWDKFRQRFVDDES